MIVIDNVELDIKNAEDIKIPETLYPEAEKAITEFLQETRDKTVILLGTHLPLQEFVKYFLTYKYDRGLEFLPRSAIHHSQYLLNFKGALLGRSNPIIATQSKEFIEIILKTNEQVTFAFFDKHFKFHYFTKEEVTAIYNSNQDLRDYDDWNNNYK